MLNPLLSGHRSLVLFDLKGGIVKERGRYALQGAEAVARDLQTVRGFTGALREFFAIQGTLFLKSFSSKQWLLQNSESYKTSPCIWPVIQHLLNVYYAPGTELNLK